MQYHCSTKGPKENTILPEHDGFFSFVLVYTSFMLSSVEYLKMCGSTQPSLFATFISDEVPVSVNAHGVQKTLPVGMRST